MPTTEQEIIDRINSRLTIPANLLEGGFSQDIIESVAYELTNIINTQVDPMLDNAFVLTADDEHIDLIGADYGIPRREDKAALVYLEITGRQGAVVNNTVKAEYNNIIFAVQEYKRVPESGKVTVKAEAQTLGTIGNVPANTITEFATNYEGLETVTNPESAYDGFNREDLETYRQRIIDYLKEDATNANKAQYHKWALEVTGVQKAIIKGNGETAGDTTVPPGQVYVYISAIDSTVSDDLINDVKKHIEAVQPINATVVVMPLNYTPMNVNAKVVLAAGYDPQDIKEEFIEAFKQYLTTVDNVVSYFRVSEILFGLVGVEDVIEYTLNGANESVELNDTDYPVVGVVDVTL